MAEAVGRRDADGRPEGRYGGRTGRSWLSVAGVVALAAAFLAWVVWAALGAAEAPVRGGLLTFEVVDETLARARIQVVRDPGTPVECVLRAVGPDRSVVGSTAVDIPLDAPQTSVVTAEVPTRTRAVAVQLTTCRAGAG